MGGEIGQWNEWNCKAEARMVSCLTIPRTWHPNMVKELNHFYLEHPALWERDFNHETFQWVDFADTQNSVISYLRKSSEEQYVMRA